jgi:dolichol-phosphate mannosyltransferase
MSAPRLSFVIPVYRNAGSLRLTHQKVVEYLTATFPAFERELLFVNDGSDDTSLSELLSLTAEDPSVKVIDLSRNFGQVAAVIAGLREVTGDAVVVMSADLQDPVELIGTLVHEWKGGNQVVIAYRANREDSLLARITSGIFYRLIKLSVPTMPPGGFDFLLLDQQANQVLSQLEERNRFFQGDVLWLGFGVKFIPYERRRREIGKSQWGLSKKVKYFIDGFLTTSYLSIRFMSLIGILVATAGFLYALLVAYGRLFHQTPFVGWAPLMIVILIIGGLIMVMLGIIGEYMWRIYDETRKRPLYVVKQRFGITQR